jgi:hypothetical protein
MVFRPPTCRGIRSGQVGDPDVDIEPTYVLPLLRQDSSLEAASDGLDDLDIFAQFCTSGEGTSKCARRSNEGRREVDEPGSQWSDAGMSAKRVSVRSTGPRRYRTGLDQWCEGLRNGLPHT